MKFNILIAKKEHVKYVGKIVAMIEDASKSHGTSIAKRTPEYIAQKIEEGKAVIAFSGDRVVGFCYIESWDNQQYVANSGLIVNKEYRGLGLSKKIKKMSFNLSRETFPHAKIFGLTTSVPVMKINTELGYLPVKYSELTDDDEFWKGCKGCVNYNTLIKTERKNCHCTGMLMDPKNEKKNTFLI